jgi:hypothetical protein
MHVRDRLRGATAAAAVLFAVLGTASAAQAKPAHLRALRDEYGPLLPAAVANCSSCHLPSENRAPTTLAEFPHNRFGKRLAALGAELRSAGKRPDLPSRLRQAASEDADGDGIGNDLELLAGSNPGDPKSSPLPAKLAAARAALPRLAQYRTAYRWRPFDPVVRPNVPVVAGAAGGTRSPIDAFLQASRARQGLTPRPEASREVLLRRVYLDLTGLSPRPEEVRLFLADRSPDAYEKVVDRLLNSPRYGERWGRHWMDVWRYSDWAGWGMQVRDSLPHIWRWRDWIVASLNADKPYDRMVQEMLAGDELAPDDPEVLPATGFLVRNYKLLSREKWMQDTVDHTGQAFLGLTVGCARCHDHMYDPISQKEYYRLRAVFEPHNVRTDWVPGELDTKKSGLPRAFDAKLQEPTYLFTRGDERQPVKDEPLSPGVPESLGGRFEVHSIPVPRSARVPERKPFVLDALRKESDERVEQARRALAACAAPEETGPAQARLDAAEAGRDALHAVLRAEELDESGKQASPEWKEAALAATAAQRRQARADAVVARLDATEAIQKLRQGEKPAAAATKKAEDALAAAEKALAEAEKALAAPPSTSFKPRIASSFPEQSTGRRLALARWITAPENPLAARVAANQIWMRHFGQPLQPTVADFGRNGTPPLHPELLDWLASELMRGGWKMKPLHRLIVTSRAYRMASTPDPAALAKDPDNRYYWRMNSRRMDAEVVRDNVLYVCGQLDMKLGGPDIDQAQGLKVKRRTLYFRHAAEKEMVFTNIFDGPSVTECYMRKQTVVPQQALALANSELAITQARLLARELTTQASPVPARFVEAAFERVLARAPSRAERDECVAFLSRLAAQLRSGSPGGEAKEGAASADPAMRARENLILVLLNHNDFVTVR